MLRNNYKIEDIRILNSKHYYKTIKEKQKMKTKIDVVFNVSNYGVDPKVTMRALLRKENAVYKKGSLAGALVIKPKYEIKRYETFQLIAANYGLLDELDQAANDGRGGTKLIIEGMPAECIHAIRKDGSEYDAIIINFGSEENPHPRAFYLSDIQSELIKKSFKPQAEFTLQENPNEEEEPEEEE